MGHYIDEKKDIENDTNNNKNKNDVLKGRSIADKYKVNSYEKIKDIVMNGDRDIIVKKNIKNNKNNDIKKPTVDIGL